jgi:hypothetical protein
MRSTGRVVPIVVLGLVVVLGLGVNVAHARLRANGRPVLAAAAVAVVVAMIVVNFPSLFNGSFYGANLQRDEEIPGYWSDAAAFLDDGDHATRVLEVPGADFASYRWGNTVDPITPGLVDRPYLARELIPYGTPGTADLLNALDRRLQDGVADPDGVAALLRRLGVGTVVLRNDIQYERYDVVPPRELARLFPRIAGLGPPTAFGTPSVPVLDRPYQDEISLGAPPNEPPAAPVVAYPVLGATPIARAEPTAHALMVAGDGEGLVDAADVGLLDAAGVIQYSGSYPDGSELRDALRDDTVLVVTDQNRDRARRWTSVRDNLGTTDGPGIEPLRNDPGDARLDLFPGANDDASTITKHRGVRGVASTSYGNVITYTPENRAARALDGDVTTAWRAATFGDPIGERIRIEFEEAITTDHVELVQPLDDPRDRYITRARLVFDGDDELDLELDATSRTGAGQTVRFDPRTFDTLELEVTGVNTPARKLLGTSDAVGLAEIRVRDDGAPADVRLREVVVMPRDLLGAVGEGSASHPLVLVMSRDRLRPAPPRSDPERVIAREFTLPTSRTFALTGNASVSPEATHEVIDAALGVPDARAGGVTTDASRFMSGCLGCRADQAIDGDPATAWQTPFVDVRGQWVEYELPAPITFDHLDLRVIADGRHSVPTRLRLEVDGATRELVLPALADHAAENASETVRMTFAPVTGRTIRVTVDDVREGLSYRFGAANSTRLEPAAIAELGIPALRLAAAPATIDTGCRDDLVLLDGEPLPVRVQGDAANASTLAGLAVAPCRPGGLALAAGPHVLETAPGAATGFAVDRLVLASDAGGEPLTVAGGRVTGLGAAPPPAPRVELVAGDDTKVRVRVTGATEPFWLVLGQSQSPGWRASVAGGESLGGSRLVDGYANGWLIDPAADTFEVTMEWTPQRTVRAGLGLSVAAVMLCLAIVVVTGIRRRGTLALHTAPAPADADVALVWPGAGHEPCGSVGARAVVPAVVGVFAALAVGPWCGVLAAAVAVVVMLRPSWRALLVFVPPALLLTAGVYIVYLQRRYEFPSVFEWPTLFPRATTLAWIALALVGVDVVLELARPWRRRVPDSNGAHAPDG